MPKQLSRAKPFFGTAIFYFNGLGIAIAAAARPGAVCKAYHPQVVRAVLGERAPFCSLESRNEKEEKYCNNQQNNGDFDESECCGGLAMLTHAHRSKGSNRKDLMMEDK